MVKITGFDTLTRQLGDAQKAMKELDGALTTVKFDPTDQSSVRAAIRDMERAVDQKVNRYRDNPLVANVAKQTKAHFREAINKQAREACR